MMTDDWRPDLADNWYNDETWDWRPDSEPAQDCPTEHQPNFALDITGRVSARAAALCAASEQLQGRIQRASSGWRSSHGCRLLKSAAGGLPSQPKRTPLSCSLALQCLDFADVLYARPQCPFLSLVHKCPIEPQPLVVHVMVQLAGSAANRQGPNKAWPKSAVPCWAVAAVGPGLA